MRWLGNNPAFFPAFINNSALDGLDGDRGCIDSQNAGAFARRRADSASKLGEVVCFVQPIERFFPQASIDEVVPLGNQVVDRAAGCHSADERSCMAERNAAI